MRRVGLWLKSKQIRNGVCLLLVVIAFSFGALTGRGNLRFGSGSGFKDQTGLSSTIDYSSVNRLYDQLRQNYDGKLTSSQVLDGLKHGLAQSAGDPYTQYFTASEAKAFNGELQGISLTGIGAELDQDQQGNIVVMSPIDGSPAAAAGVRAKDIIVTINGQSTAGMSLGDAVNKIRGPKGSKVTLGIQRGNQPLSLPITRDTINVPTATFKILDGNIGYLQIRQFSHDTPQLAEAAASKFQQAGVKKVVVDLRDNPGGEVDSARDIASLWLPDNAVVMQAKRGSNIIEDDRASGKNPLHGLSTVVLVNAGSASAAEITALALHDNKAATILGEKSYGKGVMQSVIPFSDGSELKVTIAKWYGPNGENINHTGITPDQTVTQPTDATPDNDPQLKAAESYLILH